MSDTTHSSAARATNQRVLLKQNRLFTTALSVWRSIPEGQLRNRLRSTGYRVRVGLPRELQINPGDTVVQVGMWREASLLRLANAVGPAGRGLVVEASPDHVEAGRKLFAERKIDNIEFVNMGAWNSEGSMEVRRARDPSGFQLSEAKTLSPEEFTGETFTVPVTRMERLCAEKGIDSIDYLEITVNGVELEVLEGCGELLQRVDRVFTAGMMRDPSTMQPLNTQIAGSLEAAGFKTCISRRGRQLEGDWGRVDGHVFGWRS